MDNKILEAKKLLERYAPEGEFLAYINKDEEQILKNLGGSGEKIKETGIPSFNPLYIAGAMALSVGMSYMGSLQQSKQLKAAAAWDRYHLNIKKTQDTIMANKQASKILSEKRAAIGARGIQFSGSSLMEQESVIDNLEDTLFWVNKGVEMDLKTMDVRLAGALAKESWDRKTSLLSGMTKSYSVGSGTTTTTTKAG
tara:strand:- start:47 stop:637 length:591 start_codon:yes stop_codon:yes gene_type:complete